MAYVVALVKPVPVENVLPSDINVEYAVTGGLTSRPLLTIDGIGVIIGMLFELFANMADTDELMSAGSRVML